MINKSISDFASERERDFQSTNKFNSNRNQTIDELNKSSDSAQQTAEQIISKYSSYSKSELECEIKDRVASLKQMGQFDKQKLIDNFSMIEGFLSPEQRLQMLNMIEELDGKN